MERNQILQNSMQVPVRPLFSTCSLYYVHVTSIMCTRDFARGLHLLVPLPRDIFLCACDRSRDRSRDPVHVTGGAVRTAGDAARARGGPG
eukprot:3177848-Rhodomonas_salina.5